MPCFYSSRFTIVKHAHKMHEWTFLLQGDLCTSTTECTTEDLRTTVPSSTAESTTEHLRTIVHLNMDLKNGIVKSTIWSVALYAAETWTRTKTLRKKLEAFESWVWRRMLKISRTEKKSQMKRFGKELVKKNPSYEQYSRGNITGWGTYYVMMACC